MQPDVFFNSSKTFQSDSVNCFCRFSPPHSLKSDRCFFKFCSAAGVGVKIWIQILSSGIRPSLEYFFFFWWLSTSILYIWTQLSTLVTVLFTFSKQAGYFSVDAFEGNSRLFLICITKFRQFCTEFRGILYTFTVHFRACTFLLLLKVESVLLFLCTTCLQIILPFFLCPHVRELSHKASD